MWKRFHTYCLIILHCMHSQLWKRFLKETCHGGNHS